MAEGAAARGVHPHFVKSFGIIRRGYFGDQCACISSGTWLAPVPKLQPAGNHSNVSAAAAAGRKAALAALTAARTSPAHGSETRSEIGPEIDPELQLAPLSATPPMALAPPALAEGRGGADASADTEAGRAGGGREEGEGGGREDGWQMVEAPALEPAEQHRCRPHHHP